MACKVMVWFGAFVCQCCVACTLTQSFPSVHISRVGACMYVYVRISTFLCMYVCRCICVYGGCYLELGILQDSKEKLDLSRSMHQANDFCFPAGFAAAPVAQAAAT